MWAKNHSRIMKKQFEDGRVPWNKGLDMKDDPRCKGGKKNKGRVMDPSVGEATRIRQTGKKQSAETSEKKRKSMTGFIRGAQSDEHRKAIADGVRGKPKAEGHGDNVAAANRGVTIINKDGVEKRVKGDLQSWLALGWAKGRPPKESKKRGPYKKKEAA